MFLRSPSTEKRRGRNQWWDLVGRLFLACCALGLAGGAFWNGSFRLGRGSIRRGILISRAADPFAFWFIIVGLTALGLGMAAYAVWTFRKAGADE